MELWIILHQFKFAFDQFTSRMADERDRKMYKT